MTGGGAASAHRVRSARPRRLLVLAALLLAIAGTFAPASAPVARAANDGLVLGTSTTYALVPARHVVRVTVDLTARNEKPNVTSGGIITKYFYEGARIAVQPEATKVRATSGGVTLTSKTTAADGYRVLEVRFRSALFYHQSTTVRITFDLPGGAPRSASDIRVGTAFATFVAWAFGDTASVRVVVPAGFEAETTGSTVAKSTSGGAMIFRATGITDIGAWYLVVNADRKAALTTDRIDLAGGEHVVVRAWPEDKEWRTRVAELMTKGLPELVTDTGLHWPVAADLSVFEVHTPLLEGYGGVFFTDENRIEISEDLDDLTILHEASHAWFNRGLFDGRWINEGLADTYAAKALEVVGSGGWAPKEVSPNDKAAVRLVDWTHPGRITDDETDARERYGYDAAWTVVRTLVRQVGDARMQDVLAAASEHRIAYVGAPPAETVSGPNDWRRLLDLLEGIGGSTTATDVFRRWVVNEAQADQLDKRAVARTAYAALAAAGGDWRAPFYVRGPLSDWDWVTATPRMAEATAILARRDALAARAASLGASLPDDLRAAYEGATDSLDAANRIADAEDAAAGALATAIEAVDAPRAPLVTLGLAGTTPELDLAAARAAFSAGGPDAVARAAAVTALIDGSVEIGRGRLLSAVAGLVGLAVLLVIAVVVIRRRRARRPLRIAQAHPVAAPALAGDVARESAGDAAPYATLADQPDGSVEPPAGEAAETGLAPPDPVIVEPPEPPPADRGPAS